MLGKKQPANKGLSRQSCAYRLPHQRQADTSLTEAECECTPHISACHCAAPHSRWVRRDLSNLLSKPRPVSLVAYIRETEGARTAQEQSSLIAAYCDEHGYRVLHTFMDHGKPSSGLQQALQEAERTDGLIASDLNRFVEHPDDRLRDLRPFIHHFFCHTAKHLVAVEEGIDTAFPIGQLRAMDLIKQSKEEY